MDIPDLTCTVLVRTYSWPWRIPIANVQDLHWKSQIPVNILPRTVRTSRLHQNVALRMRINGHTRLDLVRTYSWRWRIPIANVQDLHWKTQIPVNILPRTVRTSRLHQNAALRLRINGHTRLDRTRNVQVKSGMSIDSHPESYVLVRTASPYSPGKYVNWNLSFFNGDPV